MPWNIVLSVAEEVFLKVNSGFNAFDATSDFTTVFFPLGFGGGVTVGGERLMSDVGLLFSWPLLGAVQRGLPSGADRSFTTTDVWTITVGATFYSPVLF